MPCDSIPRILPTFILKGFSPDKVLDHKEMRKLDPFSIYAIVATNEAMEMSGLNNQNFDYDRAGVVIGTGVGGIQTLEEQHSTIENRGARRVSPQFVPKMISNIAGGHLALRWSLKGPNQTVTSACASATDAIGIAMRLILSGDADIMITGGTEASITPLTIAGFANMRALSQFNSDPQKASRPFDNNRDGFVLGEGSGMLVIETERHAKNRGADFFGVRAAHLEGVDALAILVQVEHEVHAAPGTRPARTERDRAVASLSKASCREPGGYMQGEKLRGRCPRRVPRDGEVQSPPPVPDGLAALAHAPRAKGRACSRRTRPTFK